MAPARLRTIAGVVQMSTLIAAAATLQSCAAAGGGRDR
jgi:hypothetical protein